MPPLLPPTIAFVTTFLAAAVLANLRNRPIARVRSAAHALARDPLAAPAIVFAVAFACFSLPLILGGAIAPWSHDEFANLLAADTFLHGRLTNPTPPLWQHFQTFHELMVPSYQSKFPPAGALLMALGALLHLPHAGTTAAMALACIFLWAALRAWLPPTPALVAALLPATLLLLTIWSVGYWGASATMLGASLLFWAVCDALRDRRPRALLRGCACAAGLAILANSRPLEGLIYAALLTVWCALAARRRPDRRHRLALMIVWAIPLLAAAGGWNLYYNARVTGSHLEPPYLAHARQYMTEPLLRWQHPPVGPRTDALSRIVRFHTEVEGPEYTREDTWPGFWSATGQKFASAAQSFFAPAVLALPLILLPLIARLPRRRQRVLLAAIAGPLIVALALVPIQICLTRWFRLHYFAPVLPPLILAIASAVRIVARALPGLRRYRLAMPLMLALVAAALTSSIAFARTAAQTNPMQTRAKLVDFIRSQAAASLVIVREDDDFSTLSEFVFNDADLPTSPVIFAHAIDPILDEQLIRAFPARRVWYLQCSASGVNLSDQPTAAQPP